MAVSFGAATALQGYNMKQDTYSAQVMVDEDRAAINGGDAFIASLNTGLLSGDALYKFSLKTPSDGKLVKLMPSVISASANTMKFELYEDTAATGGTNVFARNMVRSVSAQISESTIKAGETAALTGKSIIASTAGGNFGNQPNNDGVEIVSDDAGDTTQSVTLWGTLHGATGVVISEVVALAGTTQAVSTHTNWSKILGVELSASCAGTVTVREASGNEAITTISTGVLSAGVAVIAESEARDTILRHDASGASTKDIGIVGTAPNGSSLTSVDALNGATEENHNSDVFRTVTKVLVGDVASSTNCWILRPEVVLQTMYCGTNVTKSFPVGGMILEPGTTYVVAVTNGSTTSSIGIIDLMFAEIDMGIVP